LVRRAALLLALVCLSTAAFAQSLSTVDPEGAGFVPHRLARIADWYQAQIAEGAFPGAVVALARDGKLATLQAIGTYDRAGKKPLKPDAIFWIASMTKPVTSVAAMMLVEEGKLDLEAPVAKYLPEFADMKVGVERIDPVTRKPSVSAVPAKRQMQVIDLLRHTSGLVYPEEASDFLHKIYNLIDFSRDRTLADLTKSLGWMPLVHQPGEAWEYSLGVDVLARVVEVVSGQRFDQFLQQRIFGPLRMVDTGFTVPPEKLDRLVDPLPGGWPALFDITKPKTLFSGGGGLASTAPDYLRFCQMLLNGGELDGVRLLQAATVMRMTTPALPADVTFAGEQGQWVGPQVGSSWGLGFAIRTDPKDSPIVPGAVGTYKWSGFWGTDFWIDPAEKLIALLMIQTPPDKNHGQYRNGLRLLGYGALAGPKEMISQRAVSVDAATLATNVGTYDFGHSLSAHDRETVPTYPGVGLPLLIEKDVLVTGQPYAGSPAAKAGLVKGEVVEEIDAQSTKGLAMAAVIDRMRGPAGSEVRLAVKRPGEDKARAITIVRRMVSPPGAQLKVTLDGNTLVAMAVGSWDVLDFDRDKPATLLAQSPTEFVALGTTRLAFTKDAGGKVTGLILNPGPEQIEARRVD
jgi:CubicO group peptidase (beta-lactamase class C family)